MPLSSPTPPSLLHPPPRPHLRARASSTSLRPPLSLATLSPRPRAGSFTVPESSCSSSSSPISSCASTSTSSPAHEPPILDLQAPQPALSETQRTGFWAMFPVLYKRTVELARALRPGASGKHATSLFVSPIASPRSSTDTDYILPLSASSYKTSFDADDLAPPPHIREYFRLPTFPSVHAPLLLVLVLLPLSTGFVLLSLSSLPITFAWPRTLSDLAQLGRELNTYAQSGLLPTAHVFAVLSVSAVWKHAWSIPGSVLWNVLAGALFHPLLATLVMTALTTLGSLFSTLLAMPLAPILTRFFPRPIEITRSALEGSSASSSSSSSSSVEYKPLQPSNLTATSSSSSATSTSAKTPTWVRLSVLRLVGVVPWSALNVACGITGVALFDCATGAFIGTLPWTAVTCQIGDILHTVGVVSANGSVDDSFGEGISKSATLSSVLASPQIVFELIFLSILSLAPILGRRQLRRFISPSREDTAIVELATAEDDEATDNIDEKSEAASVTEQDDDVEFEKFGRRGRRAHRQRWTWKRLSMSVPRWSLLHSEDQQSLLNEESIRSQ